MQQMEEEEANEGQEGKGSRGEEAMGGQTANANNHANEDLDILLGDTATQNNPTATDTSTDSSSVDIELAISHTEHLTKRPLLLNCILLWQNPHTISE